MKYLIVLFLGIAAVTARKRYDGYQVLEVYPQNARHAEILMTLQSKSVVNILNELTHNNKPASLLVSPTHLMKVKNILRQMRIQFTVTNNNVQKVLDEEYARLQNKQAFDLDDYNTLDDIYNQLDVWVENCPEELTCSLYSIGTTVEDRSIQALRIGTGNPVIIMDSLIHAREWLTGATMLKIIDNILTNSETDDDVVNLLEKYDFVIVPVLNPDGYDYTWTNDRFWRKNRVENQGSTCRGVDLNRNFAVDEWGLQGVDHFACSEVYCGPSAGSELETQALQDEALRLQGEDESGIVAWVTMHNYGRMWMYPWGYTEDFTFLTDCVHTDDYDDLYFVSEAVQTAIHGSSGTMWDIGTSCEVIYATTGGTDDWGKAKAGVKYPFCPELRGFGFDVPPDQIQPSYEEVWAGIVAMMGAIEEVESQ